MKTKILVCIATLVMLASPTWCQGKPSAKDTIWVGSDLQLGLPRDAVMSHLSEEHNLEKHGTVDSWFVKSKTAPFVRYGQVSFSNGKLSCASRLWTGGEDGDFAFANVLHGVLDQFKREGRHVCSISTDSNRDPEVEERSITMHCGAKMLIIQTQEFFLKNANGRPSKGESTLIEEVLSSEGNKLCSIF